MQRLCSVEVRSTAYESDRGWLKVLALFAVLYLSILFLLFAVVGMSASFEPSKPSDILWPIYLFVSMPAFVILVFLLEDE